MLLSKKCRYGLRAMIDLASQPTDTQTSLAQIAERNGISPQYLEQVFAALKRGGLVCSVKGPMGGYYLARPAEQITAAQIVTALSGSYYEAEETAGPGCSMEGIAESVQAVLIEPLNRDLDRFFQKITLEDLLQDYHQNRQGAENMYYI